MMQARWRSACLTFAKAKQFKRQLVQAVARPGKRLQHAEVIQPRQRFAQRHGASAPSLLNQPVLTQEFSAFISAHDTV